MTQQSRPLNHDGSLKLGGHIPALDGVRGVAILLVMLYHQTVYKGGTAFDDAYRYVLDLGWIGVDMFFVLSGFLITGILDSMKSRQNFFRNFYARRVLRIFPLYYLVVFVALVIVPQAGAIIEQIPQLERIISPQLVQDKLDNFGRVEGDEIWYWLYLSNIPIAIRGFQHGILDISWSLAIEEQFYLVWPALVFLLSRRAMMRLCIAMIAFAIAFRTILMFAFDTNPVAIYVLTPGRWDGLAVGAFIALWLHSGGSFHLARRWATRAVIASVPLVAALFAMDLAMGWHHREGYMENTAFGYSIQTLGYTALAFLFGGILVLALSPEVSARIPRIFRWRPLIVLGKYSYALYLFHLPVRAIFRDVVFPPHKFPTLFGSALPGQIIFYIISSIATLLLCLLSWHLFEKHFLNLKRFFPSAPPIRENERRS